MKISELPEDIRLIAEKRREEGFMNKDSDQLSRAFSWGDAPEGPELWYYIECNMDLEKQYNRIREINNLPMNVADVVESLKESRKKTRREGSITVYNLLGAEETTEEPVKPVKFSGLISDLPEPIKSRAIDCRNKEFPGSTNDSIITAFDWGKTSEGHGIWDNVFHGDFESFHKSHSIQLKQETNNNETKPTIMPKIPDSAIAELELIIIEHGNKHNSDRPIVIIENKKTDVDPINIMYRIGGTGPFTLMVHAQRKCFHVSFSGAGSWVHKDYAMEVSRWMELNL